MAHHQILMVGAGNANISLAAQLLLQDKSLKITLIDPSDKHYYQPAWTLVGSGEFQIEDTVRPQGDYIPKGCIWIQDAVVSFDPENNALSTAKGETHSYDYLVVSPGIQLDWEKISGAKESIGKNNVSSNYLYETAPYTWELIKNFKGGIAVFTNPATPIKCGGAPHKIMYLACDYWRKNGVLDKTEVHYISGATMIFGVPEYKATLEEVLKKYNIRTHYAANVIAIDGDDSRLTYQTKENPFNDAKKLDGKSAGCFSLAQSDPNAETHTITVNYDFCHVVPPQSAPDFIKQSQLADANNPHGYVEVDKHTFRHTRYANVFAFGDASNAPASKTGAAIRKQAPVVCAHILASIQGKTSDASYNGYSACPIPTQYGKLMLAEFNYDNKPQMSFPFDQAVPRWTMWMLKKYVLPWLYWNRILTGKA
ncbi:MAG: NAD(P)/FAD-dependent oxidoreductase [Chitinophagales bacterium]|nr:NAD(P)/FAD-dependent oxidoreductase [Chitinophagales bacterium]